MKQTPNIPRTGGHVPRTAFKPGVSGNPAGRPKGARSKIEESFLEVVYKDWQANGAAVIEQVRATDPSTYLRVIAQILPKESKVDVEHSGAIEHRGLPEISQRVSELLAGRADRDSPALLSH